MDIVAYRKWIQNTDYWYSRFDLLANQLTEYLLNYRLNDEEFAKEVAAKFDDVLHNCDEIDYQEDSTATAYSILHFLPRYHRFQLIFSKLIDKGVFPPKKSPINILDVGTGPGPSLYALSDIYLSLKLFGDKKYRKIWDEEQYFPDYVERSSGFRNWLHHFTEIANYKKDRDIDNWIVPYHNGTFHDFREIQFDETYSFMDVDYEGDYFTKTRKRKYRYNVIIFSNFLTKISQVESLSSELQNCMRFLRNNGKLIISGGTGKSQHNLDKDYPEMYKRTKEIILENVYGNQYFIAKAKYLKISRNKLVFNFTDKFGSRIKEFNNAIFNRLAEFGAIDSIPEKAKKPILLSLKEEYDFPSKWEFHVFEKFSRHVSSLKY